MLVLPLHIHTIQYTQNSTYQKNACMHTTQVISYLHGLPDDTWQEPNPDEPLSMVDQVLWTTSSDAVKTSEIPNKSPPFV